MSNTNDGPKTYYGPWLKTIPVEMPDGSLWEVDSLCFKNHCVAAGGRFFVVKQQAIEYTGEGRYRRVWPPGSVVPEPRPFVVDGKVQSMEQSEWWMISSTRTGGAYWHMMDRGYNEWLSQKPELQEGALYYPVQHLANQAMVAIPWQDQIGEVGE